MELGDDLNGGEVGKYIAFIFFKYVFKRILDFQTQKMSLSQLNSLVLSSTNTNCHPKLQADSWMSTRMSYHPYTSPPKYLDPRQNQMQTVSLVRNALAHSQAEPDSLITKHPNAAKNPNTDARFAANPTLVLDHWKHTQPCTPESYRTSVRSAIRPSGR